MAKAPNSAPPVTPEQIDAVAYQVIKASRKLENGATSTPEFIDFIIETLVGIGAVARKRRIEITPTAPPEA